MSGGFIALGLVVAYLAHAYFLWRSGRKPGQTRDEEEESRHKGKKQP